MRPSPRSLRNLPRRSPLQEGAQAVAEGSEPPRIRSSHARSARRRRSPRPSRGKVRSTSATLVQARPEGVGRRRGADRGGAQGAPEAGAARRGPRPSLPTLPTLSRARWQAVSSVSRSRFPDRGRRVRNGEAPELLQAARTPLDHGIVVNGELRDPEALPSRSRPLRRAQAAEAASCGSCNREQPDRRCARVRSDRDRRSEAAREAIRFRAQEVLPIPLEEAVLRSGPLRRRHRGRAATSPACSSSSPIGSLVDRYVYACRTAGLQSSGSTSRHSRCCRPSPLRTTRAPAPSVARLVAARSVTTRSTFAVSDGRVCEFTRWLEWGAGR